MQVIYEYTNEWQEWDRRLVDVLAVAGLKSELELKVPGCGGPYQWAVSLEEEHPLWGENAGSARTLEQAKRQAEQFLKKVK